MTADRVRADYEQLAEIAESFGGQADCIRSLLQALNCQKQVLESGDWVGKGADKFYAEMNGAVLPDSSDWGTHSPVLDRPRKESATS